MDFLHNLHSILRWLLVAVAVYAIVRALLGMVQKSTFSQTDNKAGLFYVSVFDTQVLLGLILYFTGSMGFKSIQANGMKLVMGTDMLRFFAVEHITGMLIALVLVHIGRSKSKKAGTDHAKHKAAFWFYLIGFLIMLASIPWPFRSGFEGLGWY
jgi:hypothetical protein